MAVWVEIVEKPTFVYAAARTAQRPVINGEPFGGLPDGTAV